MSMPRLNVFVIAASAIVATVPAALAQSERQPGGVEHAPSMPGAMPPPPAAAAPSMSMPRPAPPVPSLESPRPAPPAAKPAAPKLPEAKPPASTGSKKKAARSGAMRQLDSGPSDSMDKSRSVKGGNERQPGGVEHAPGGVEHAPGGM